VSVLANQAYLLTPACPSVNPTNCLTVIMVSRITLNLREAGDTKPGWIGEPTFSFSTFRLSRMSGWPPPVSPNLSRKGRPPGPGGEMEGGLGQSTASWNEIEMNLLQRPTPLWHTHAESRSYNDQDPHSSSFLVLDLKPQRQPNWLKDTFPNPEPIPNPRAYEQYRPPPLVEEGPSATHRTDPSLPRPRFVRS